MYECGRCFLRPDVASEVVKIHRELQAKGYGLKMFDCYRPRPIQWKLWEKVPDPRYVADPRKGSMHNRGMAVDLTIVDSLGNELDMGTDFDFFGKEAYHAYSDHSAEVATNRKLLLSTMKAHHFRPPPPSGGIIRGNPKLGKSTIGCGGANERRSKLEWQ